MDFTRQFTCLNNDAIERKARELVVEHGENWKLKF